MASEPPSKKARVAPDGLAADHPRVICRARFPGKDATPKEFHYFCLRGLGEVPRLLLEVSQTPYDSIMTFSTKEFKDMAPFGQMPLYKGPELGDMVMAQSGSICRHIAAEVGMIGNTPQARALNDMVFELGKDIQGQREGIHKDEVPEKLVSLLAKAQEMLGSNGGPYLTGKDLGYGDVHVFHWLSTYEEIKPGLLKPWPKLGDFVQAVATLPAVAAYLKSPRRVPLTHNERGDKPHAGMAGYSYITPLDPKTCEEVYDN
eukprot:gnl/TRDRNA2_/TRDRNA2_197418_c0_seq1.p1 gnl/TRDRNA2_/TRDRNA2_197418_c0~~gnl/TRDRNA2_/TRDRNA2_197418_c0_seq1.p1  ORF type:complete len:260 (+),score=49.81 gnl/TRDRNA2_/TRDRNA2_197418_c0_seq1:33-812(+)